MPSKTDMIYERCSKAISSLGLSDARYQEKFKSEITDLKNWQEYGGRDMADRLLKRADENRNVNSNKSGSLLLYLLGISSIDPIVNNIQTQYTCLKQGDIPDIDTDFDPRIRDEIKKYIVETFGENNTCSVGTYGTYKTRAVILDIARVLGLDYHEAAELTKSLEMAVSVENDEGEEEEVSIDKVDFDELIEQFADLRQYFEKHPEVLIHAQLLRNQVRHISTHAGGVIISDLILKDHIPVFEDKDGRVVSCWNESGNSTELSSVGLVKFDILGLKNLSVVSDCVKLIAQTQHKEISRWEIPIDDKEAIRMGSKRDLVGIFQFENPSVIPVVEAVGMDCLEDVAAITSLIRPGPRNMGMDMEYARRKNKEPYSEVETMKTLLADTYGVMVYQEQCCVGSVLVRTSNGIIRMDDLICRIERGDEISVACLSKKGEVVYRKVIRSYRNGNKAVCRVRLDNGMEITCTEDHRVLTSNRGWVQVQYLLPDDDIVTTDDME